MLNLCFGWQESFVGDADKSAAKDKDNQDAEWSCSRGDVFHMFTKLIFDNLKSSDRSCYVTVASIKEMLRECHEDPFSRCLCRH